MLDKPPRDRLPSLARAATSPSAIVLAGAGVAAGEAAHLGLAVAGVLGAAGYGARLAWAMARRRAMLRRRSRRHRARVDPWSVPEPWRGLTARALRARKQLQQLARDCPPGPLSDQIARASAIAAAAVEEQWGLARVGAAVAGPGQRADKVAAALVALQDRLSRTTGPERPALEGREEQLAAELRSLRRSLAAADEISARLGGLVDQMEQLVAAAGRLMGATVPVSAGLAGISSRLEALVAALDEAREDVAGGGEPGEGTGTH